MLEALVMQAQLEQLVLRAQPDQPDQRVRQEAEEHR